MRAQGAEIAVARRSRRPGWTSAALAGALLAAGALAAAQDSTRPNLLWITAEDMGPHLGSFGDVYAVTPSIDRLAAEGVRYTNAFAPAGVCAPARSSLILGLYAPAVGSQHMRSRAALPPQLRLFSELLRERGYYCTNNSKQDYNLSDVPGEAWDESSPTAHWRKRPDPERPFFAIFNITTTHESQIRLPEEEYRERTEGFAAHERHDPALATVPPYHPDVPEVRRDWARYADMVTLMDRRVGEILAELESDGLAGDTIVFFYSDHGAGMPRSKRWLYDSGLRVPLVIRFPERYRELAPAAPGSLSDRLVDFTDLGPTALSLAGVAPPESMQGQPFLGAHRTAPRRYTYAFRGRMDERYDMVRSVRDRRFRYIRNYLPHEVYAQHIDYMFQMPTMRVWRARHRRGELRGPERRFFETKSPEELYDTRADPHEVHNLAGDASYEDVLRRMRGELRRWLLEIRDTGFLPEAELHVRSAGSTPWALGRDRGRYDLERILDRAERASLGAGVAELVEMLRDRDPAVRFWGAAGLNGAGDALAARSALAAALSDPSPDVAVAAAEALASVGEHERALPALLTALRHDSPWVRLRAATVLDELGERARPGRADMERAAARWESEEHPGWMSFYLPRVLEHALAGLGS